MKAKDFNKLQKEEKPTEILEKYMTNKIFLTERQLDKCITAKKGTSSEGHGGVSFNYRKAKNRDDALFQDRSKRTVKCICGHSIVFLNKTEKTICTWCGRYVYNKNMNGQKRKFKDNFFKAQKKGKNNKNENKNK